MLGCGVHDVGFGFRVWSSGELRNPGIGFRVCDPGLASGCAIQDAGFGSNLGFKMQDLVRIWGSGCRFCSGFGGLDVGFGLQP